MEWNRKPVFGMGINDVPEYTKGTKPYVVWKSMLARCYSPYTQAKNPTYVGCSVCEKWLLFSEFKSWFESNYIPGTQLDKDILRPNNKVYSPETCCFVPHGINALFSGHSRRKGISVGVHKQCNRYIAELRFNGKRHKRSFDNQKEAEEFYAKQHLMAINEAAETYYSKGLITNKTYKALLNYGMEIH